MDIGEPCLLAKVHNHSKDALAPPLVADITASMAAGGFPLFRSCCGSGLLVRARRTAL